VSGKVIRDKLKLALRLHVNKLKAETLLKEKANDPVFEISNTSFTIFKPLKIVILFPFFSSFLPVLAR